MKGGTKNNTALKSTMECECVAIVKKLKYYDDAFRFPSFGQPTVMARPRMHYVRIFSSTFTCGAPGAFQGSTYTVFTPPYPVSPLALHPQQ